MADLVVVEGGAAPDIRMLEIDQRLPLAGHTAALAMPAIYGLIRGHKTTLVFVNTRLQAEFVFQELWNLNEDGLPIALHHGSLDATQRRRVEAAMAAGELRGVVCTATLDLGIDWGDVDLVVNVGAPKGASRIMQRIGRSNHRMDEPSQAYLVPANRFEILECRAALDAVHEAAQDTPDARVGRSTCSASTCSAWPARSRSPWRTSTRRCAPPRPIRACTGRISRRPSTSWRRRLRARAYERFAKIVRGPDGLWRVRDGAVAQQYRLNVGTIVEATMIKVRLARAPAASPGTVLPARRAHPRRGRGVFRRDHDRRRHLPVRRRGAALRGDPRGRGAGSTRAPPARTPRSRPMPAASSRSPPFSPNASAPFSPILSNGTGCRGR
jgi:ATP-dependent Lhr-like helicase